MFVPLRNVTFVDNVAAGTGGAVSGLFTIELASFRNNSAGIAGDDINGALGIMTTEMYGVAAWPNPIIAPFNGFDENFWLTSSCVVEGTNNSNGGGNVLLDQDPFIEADLDNDGVIELYIDPSSPCHDLDGPVDPELWSTLTTDITQCTDSAPSDAGRHDLPLSDEGACL